MVLGNLARQSADEWSHGQSYSIMFSQAPEMDHAISKADWSSLLGESFSRGGHCR